MRNETLQSDREGKPNLLRAGETNPAGAAGPRKFDFSNINPGTLLARVVILFFMGLTGLWLHLNRGPTQFDDSWYLIDSLKMYDALSTRGIAGWFSEFLAAQDRGKAPLICALPTPLYLIFGRMIKAAFWVNLMFIPVLLGSVFAIARRFCGTRIALLAIFITGTMPEFYGLSEHFYVEYGLSAFAALAVWLLVSSADLTRTSRVIWLSIVLGLGCLQKILFPIYLALLVIYFLGRWARRLARLPAGGDGKTPWPLKTLAALVIPALLVAGPWYVVNFQPAIARAVYSGFDAQEANRFGTGNPFTVSAVYRYGKKILNEGIGATYGVMGFIVFGTIVAMRFLPARAIEPSGTAKSKGSEVLVLPESKTPDPFDLVDEAAVAAGGASLRVILLLWLLPVAGFALATNKEVRFIAPMFPAAAILLAVGVDRIIQRFRSIGIGFAVLALGFALLCQVQNSFQPLGNRTWSIPYDPADHTAHGLRFVAAKLGPAEVYERQAWPLQEVVDESIRDAGVGPGKIPTVIYASDTAHINRVNLQLTADAAALPIAFNTTSYSLPDPIIATGDLVLFRTGGEPIMGYEEAHANAARAIAGADMIESISPIAFADGGILHVFKQRYQVEPCDVEFENHVRLVGLSIKQITQEKANGGGTEKVITIHYLWTCDAPVTDNFKCFSHIANAKDSAGNPFYFDHDLMNNQPPAGKWEPGKVYEEALAKTVPTMPAEGLARVEIGLYLPGSNQVLTAKCPDLASHVGWSMFAGDKGIVVRLNARLVK
jgi:4-amino-4-deoxy-L-arabinose transferase-like glycosyltransferase